MSEKEKNELTETSIMLLLTPKELHVLQLVFKQYCYAVVPKEIITLRDKIAKAAKEVL